MFATKSGLRSLTPLCVFLVLLFLQSGRGPTRVNAQRAAEPSAELEPPTIVESVLRVDSSVDIDRLRSLPPQPVPQRVSSSGAGAGLVIIPTFNANVDATSQAIINNAIAFYQNTFTNNITVNLEFHGMSSGLGSSFTLVYFVSYSSFRTALGN